MIDRKTRDSYPLRVGDPVGAPVVEALRSDGKTVAEGLETDRFQERVVFVPVCHANEIHAAWTICKHHR